MRKTTVVVAMALAAGTWVLGFALGSGLEARQAAPLRMSSGTGLEGYLTATLIFATADADKNAVLTRDELRTAVAAWLSSADTGKSGSATRDELVTALNRAMPQSALAAMFTGGRGGQPQTPEPRSVEAMLAALPATAPAKPPRPRKVLVLARAGGFVHATIPLAAKTVEALGTKTGAWTTTISYDASDINTENLKQYDAVFLASTTGAFLDAANDPAATMARRQALLEFVRGGKGLAGIHAASDSYHAPAPAPGSGRAGAPGGGNPLASFTVGATLAPIMLANGDRNRDQKIDRSEAEALADAWFAAVDTKKADRLLQSDFAMFALLVPQVAGALPAQGPDTETGTWPEFNKMIGGYFKYHWLDPQRITVKIDDAKSPLTAMFKGQSFDVYDETYTMGANSWSRENVHVLTSIDYSKMSAEDRAQEVNPRADHDYGLSWIRREGQGRVFYEAHGHSERIYAMRPMLEHILAGVQYAIGDLKADDSPNVKAK